MKKTTQRWLLALLGVEGASTRVESLDDVATVWNAQTVTPMGTNIQFVFFRNPATGEPVTVAASKTPVFKPGKSFKEAF